MAIHERPETWRQATPDRTAGRSAWTGASWRRTTAAAAFVALSLALPACSTVDPPEETAIINQKASQYAQAMRLATTIRASGDAGSAAIFFHRAHALDPQQIEPLVGLAETAAILGAEDDAARYFRKALALDPTRADLHHGYGMLLLTLGMPQGAVDAFNEAIRLAPADARSFNGKGIALDLLGRQAEAQAAYRAGLELAPGHPTLQNNLALSLAIDGDYHAALAILTDLALEPGSGPRLRQNLGLVYALAGDLHQAVAITGRDLSEAEVRNNLAFYQMLPRLTPQERAAAVFGIGISPAPVDLAALAAQETSRPRKTTRRSPPVAFVDPAEAEARLAAAVVASPQPPIDQRPGVANRAVPGVLDTAQPEIDLADAGSDVGMTDQSLASQTDVNVNEVQTIAEDDAGGVAAADGDGNEPDPVADQQQRAEMAMIPPDFGPPLPPMVAPIAESVLPTQPEPPPPPTPIVRQRGLVLIEPALARPARRLTERLGGGIALLQLAAPPPIVSPETPSTTNTSVATFAEDLPAAENAEINETDQASR